jgi:hypothetical protein
MTHTKSLNRYLRVIRSLALRIGELSIAVVAASRSESRSPDLHIRSIRSSIRNQGRYSLAPPTPWWVRKRINCN